MPSPSGCLPMLKEVKKAVAESFMRRGLLLWGLFKAALEDSSTSNFPADAAEAAIFHDLEAILISLHPSIASADFFSQNFVAKCEL